MTLKEMFKSQTGEMSLEDFVSFVNGDLIPKLNEVWGEGCYLFKLSYNSSELIISQCCKKCGCKTYEGGCLELSEEIEDEIDELDDLLDVDSILDSPDLDDCMCYVEYWMRNIPYDRFIDIFKIDPASFSEDDYRSMITENLYEQYDHDKGLFEVDYQYIINSISLKGGKTTMNEDDYKSALDYINALNLQTYTKFYL